MRLLSLLEMAERARGREAPGVAGALFGFSSGPDPNRVTYLLTMMHM